MRQLVRILFLAATIAPGVARAQGGEEVTLVKALFAELNIRSIRENREYCGYIGWDSAGRLRASEPTRGALDNCTGEDDGLDVIASYHTHGAFSPDYASEVPSGEDMEGDADEGIDGWIATPGGRLWYIDTVDMVASQICGEGCLPQDAAYDPDDAGDIAVSYDYDDLVVYLDQW